MNTKVLGLTGGIGSGKSLVAQYLVEFGCEVIDLDKISHQLTAANGAAINAIVAQFGTQLLQPDGSLDRQQMRQLIFADANHKQQLQAILHPLIRQAAAARIEQCKAQGKAVVVEIPLLQPNSYWSQRLDGVLVVDCDLETQISRVVNRSNLSRQQVQQIIAQQPSRQQRLAMADLVILNQDLTKNELRLQVRRLVQQFFNQDLVD